MEKKTYAYSSQSMAKPTKNEHKNSFIFASKCACTFNVQFQLCVHIETKFRNSKRNGFVLFDSFVRMFLI